MDDVRISVVMPFYQGHDSIRRALLSVAMQTHRAHEVVVVDDGSPDPLGGLDTGIEVPLRVVRHDGNRGIPSARNTGVAEATGDWIAFLDQDDEWVPQKLQRQVERLRSEDDGAVVAYGRCLFAGEGDPRQGGILPGERVARRLARDGRSALRALALGGNQIPMITLLVRRDALLDLGGLDETLVGGADDYDLVLRLAARGFRFVEGDGEGRYSAIHHFTGRNFSDPLRWIADERSSLEAVARTLPWFRPLLGPALARAYYRAGRGAEMSGAKSQALRCFATAHSFDRRWYKPVVSSLLLQVPDGMGGSIHRGWRRLARRWRTSGARP